jgi:hypothetical protein
MHGSKNPTFTVLAQHQQNDERLMWFGDLSEKHKAGTRLGKALSSFDKRIFDHIRLVIDTSTVKSQQWQYYFEKMP